MKALLSKTEPRITTPVNKQEGILSWDSDNNYPDRMDMLVADSVTATSCLRIYSKFVIGRGATDLDFYKAVVNREGLRVDQFIREIIEDGKCRKNMVAVHVNFNAAFEVVEVTPIRINDLRITIDRKKAAVHADWAKKIKEGPGKFKKEDIKKYNWFDPRPEVLTAQAEEAGGWELYEGQVYLWTPSGTVDYTVAVYDPAAEDMKTEGRLKLFRFRSTDQNFLASHAVIVNASEAEAEDEELVDDNGDPIPRSPREPDHADNVQEALSEFQGADNTASLILIEKKNPEDTFELQKLELQSYDGMYRETTTDAKESILETFLVPKILLLRGTASLGSSMELELAKEFYNDITSDDRLVIEEILTAIFSLWEYPICPSGDYSIAPIKVTKVIPQEYLPFFTKNEIRASLDAPEAEEAAADKKTLVEVLGVGGTQALTGVLADPALTREQKLGILKVVFGLPEPDANEILGPAI